MKLSALKVYADRRLLAIILLGISSGIPLALNLSTLAQWFTESHVDVATIGFFALVGLPYSLKFLWAPFIDQIRIPFLGAYFGQRRSWMLLTQFLLACSIYIMGQLDPGSQLGMLSIVGIAVAFFSASQDIVIDAFRIEILDTESYGAGAAAITFGYRVGMIISTAGALYLANVFPWSVVYAIMGMCIAIGVVTVLLCKEPTKRRDPVFVSHSFSEKMVAMVVNPLVDFMKKPQWALILFFIIFYKLGDAFLGHMLPPFYKDLGFTRTEIASVTKVFGLLMTLAGGFAGGVLVYRLGMMRALLICGVIQIGASLSFILLAFEGHSIPFLIGAIGAENFTLGMGGVAFVAYLSSLCSAQFTASQYALLSALGSSGRTFFSAGAGVVAKETSWPVFFLVSAAIAVPAICALIWLMRRTPQPETTLDAVGSPS